MAARSVVDGKRMVYVDGKWVEDTHWPAFVRYAGLWWVGGFLGMLGLAFVNTWLTVPFIVVFGGFTYWNARRLITKYNLPTTFKLGPGDVACK